LPQAGKRLIGGIEASYFGSHQARVGCHRITHTPNHARQFLLELTVDGSHELHPHFGQSFTELTFEGGAPIGDDIQPTEGNHTGGNDSSRVEDGPFQQRGN
jgi:hypothetical protein